MSRVSRRRAQTRREILDAAWELARAEGVAQVTLSKIAERVGMQPPSLYTHFPSKSAVYDAMFAEGWASLLEAQQRAEASLPARPRDRLLTAARLFFDLSVADPARFTLLNQRTLKGFEPSPEAYAAAIAALDHLRGVLAGSGVRDEGQLDLAIALIGGLVNAQLANDPGGDRYRRLVPAAVDMFADFVGIGKE